MEYVVVLTRYTEPLPAVSRDLRASWTNPAIFGMAVEGTNGPASSANVPY